MRRKFKYIYIYMYVCMYVCKEKIMKEVKSSGEIKWQKGKKKGWRKCNSKYWQIGRKIVFFFNLFEYGVENFKKRKEEVENKWMMWLNRSVATINVALQLTFPFKLIFSFLLVSSIFIQIFTTFCSYIAIVFSYQQSRQISFN